MRGKTQDVLWVYVAAIVVALGLYVACKGSSAPTTPTAEPTQEANTGVVGSTEPASQQQAGNTWTENGVTVTIVDDQWGPGTCHSGGGFRRLKIENKRSETIYSKLAAYTDPALVCATQKQVTGKPQYEGPTHIEPGQSAIVTYWAKPPDCGSLQVDDCWGPGGLTGCSFVVGDVFKSTKACDECVEGEPEIECTECPESVENPEDCYRTCTKKWKCKDPETYTEACVCKTGCVEWPEPKVTEECGEWNECHEHPALDHGFDVVEPQCFQEQLCVETKTWKCKDPETREYEKVQECPCECETEWGPWEIVDVDSEETPCEPVVTFSTGNHKPVCYQTIITTTTWEQTEKCTQEKQRKQTVETEKIECDCPPEGEGCHISNQGAPGDTNFNVVLTKANAHKNHTQATHCPGDIFPPDDCTCEQAMKQAFQCGDPAAGGFTCKSNR